MKQNLAVLVWSSWKKFEARGINSFIQVILLLCSQKGALCTRLFPFLITYAGKTDICTTMLRPSHGHGLVHGSSTSAASELDLLPSLPGLSSGGTFVQDNSPHLRVSLHFRGLLSAGTVPGKVFGQVWITWKSVSLSADLWVKASAWRVSCLGGHKRILFFFLPQRTFYVSNYPPSHT